MVDHRTTDDIHIIYNRSVCWVNNRVIKLWKCVELFLEKLSDLEKTTKRFSIAKQLKRIVYLLKWKLIGDKRFQFHNLQNKKPNQSPPKRKTKSS